ncbi:MAG: S8 family peptidase [Saprospiraceae bacterium]|nr:S8 family peptidase [Saprospiraceae bacterium]
MFSFSFLVYAVTFTLLAAWFFFKEDNNKRRILGSAFFASLIGYTSLAFFISPTSVNTEQYLGNLVFLFGANLILNTFSNSRFAFWSIFAIILGGYYYVVEMEDTHSSTRLDNLDPQGELLIELSNGHQLAELSTILERYQLNTQRAFTVESGEITDLDDYYVVDIPENKVNHYNQIIEDLQQSGLIDHIEHNEQIQLSPSPKESPASPTAKKFGLNDPDLNKLWGFGAMEVDLFYNFLKEKQIRPTRKAKIAIIDTGVDAKHEDLGDNFVSTKKAYDTDPHGHGTHCAGIAAAVSNNNRGIASFAVDGSFVEVTSIKVFGASGRTTQRTIINGMLLAADQGADVLSMSLGGPSFDKSQLAYKRAVDYVNTKGGIVVAAAGNESMDAKKRVPAGVPGVITVSAIDEELNLASFSNYVQNVNMGIAAPGVNIYSTIPNNTYEYFNGTSMATPYVAGLIGIMKSIKPNMTTKEAYKLLNSTGKDTKQTLQTGKLIYPFGIIQKLSN